jgi:hypothetical protein
MFQHVYDNLSNLNHSYDRRQQLVCHTHPLVYCDTKQLSVASESAVPQSGCINWYLSQSIST